MEGQCQHFVERKKRLCRMTVQTGKNYCGEHEPQPKCDYQPQCESYKENVRIPCPFDPKHSCFANKLEKHLKICNAREQELPEYIIRNVNARIDDGSSPRVPLNAIPTDNILCVINKINKLYEENLQGKIESLSEKPIHSAVIEEFNEEGRKESSLRHLRQVSRLLHLIEDEGLVQPGTCYVDLGAGKGKLAAMAWRAWCDGKEDGGNVLLVERASLRHKRDNGTGAIRLRADLADLVLGAVPVVKQATNVVVLAKHLCGIALDYGVRGARGVRGAALATCCHHRAAPRPQKLDISDEEFNIVLGIVSWATCGDGKSRDRRNHTDGDEREDSHRDERNVAANNEIETQHQTEPRDSDVTEQAEGLGTKMLNLDQATRKLIGKRAKALIDWGRVLYLQDCGFDAKLVYYVPESVSLENLCIVAKMNK